MTLSTSKKPTNILIVEDNILSSMELEEMLTENGYYVSGVAGSGEDAIVLARDLKPDLILMDIKLPGKGDGIDAAVTIRSQLDIPSVFLTGHGEKELLARAVKADPLGYIMKPLVETQILAAVEIALAKRAQEIDLQRLQKQNSEVLQRRNTALKTVARQLAERTSSLNKLGHVVESFPQAN